MTTTSRVPGLTRNSGWAAVDAEIQRKQQQTTTDAKGTR
jgi:hypothetical protein